MIYTDSKLWSFNMLIHACSVIHVMGLGQKNEQQEFQTSTLFVSNVGHHKITLLPTYMCG